MKLQDFMQEHDFYEDFSEVETIYNSSIHPPRSITILDRECLNIPPQILNVLVDTHRLHPMSAISFIPDGEKISTLDRFCVKTNDDSVYYVGFSRGSSQFYIVNNSEINFYLFL